MPGDFQHVMTSVTLFKDIFVPISYINHLMKKKIHNIYAYISISIMNIVSEISSRRFA